MEKVEARNENARILPGGGHNDFIFSVIAEEKDFGQRLVRRLYRDPVHGHQDSRPGA